MGDFNGDGILDFAVAGGSGTLAGGSGTVTILLGKGDGSFQAAQSYDVGRVPKSLAVGDFNGDGHLDLAVANWGTDFAFTVSILQGNGDGTFQAGQSYAMGPVAEDQFLLGGPGANSVAVGDFNGDGNLDIVVTNYLYESTVSVLLGKGDGTFENAGSYGAGSLPYSVAVGDFDRDGRLDLAVANSYDGTVSILLGKGDGTFEAAQSYAVGSNPSSVAVGDFDGNGDLDLAVTNSDLYGGTPSVSILLGKGDGTFQPAQSYAVGDSPSSVVVGDFNGDGHLDLAVANGGYGIPGTVSILLGKGDGTFQAPQSYAVAPNPTAVAGGDFNRDGALDLAVANYGTYPDFNKGTVSVLLGKGDGTFQAPQSYPDLYGLPPLVADAVRGSPTMVMGDFNGDGYPDLAVVTYEPANGQGTVSVFLGNGDGTFQAAHNYDVWSYPNSVAVGDFKGDGKLDLAVATYYSVNVLLGNGDGTFQAAQVYYGAGLNPRSVTVADFNDDGKLDLAVADSTGVSILLGNGDGTFQVAHAYPVDVRFLSSLAVGDFNRDGKLDLAVAHDTGVSILLGNGDGTFQAAQSYAVGVSYSLGVGDFNGDGFPDLAVTSGAGVMVLLNDGNWGP